MPNNEKAKTIIGFAKEDSFIDDNGNHRVAVCAGYYILSRKWTKREDENLTWWGPDQSGYVYDIDKAGIYSKEEAFSISNGVHGSSIPVSVADVNRLTTRMVYKSDEALKILYSKHSEYNYRDESRPAPKHCEHCGEEIE